MWNPTKKESNCLKMAPLSLVIAMSLSCLAYFFSKTDGYGFNVKGGRDQPFRAGDPSIYITRLRHGAAAEIDGRISPGDRIIEVSYKCSMYS